MKLQTPTFLINEGICRNNIRKMAQKAKDSEVIFRPHFKTHQSAHIGKWFKEEGVSSITVSSVTMADYFARHGWKDIFIAFPFNIHEMDAVNHWASQIKLHLAVESERITRFLEDQVQFPVGIYIKIDAGYHRTGLQPQNKEEIERIINLCQTSSRLYLKGVAAHFGNTYQAKGKEEVNQIYREAVLQLLHIKQEYLQQIPDFIISIGDTPSCSLVEDLSGSDEIRPGNFVFYDLMQMNIGSCRFDEIAAVVACPVVAKHPGRNELVVYGGAVHLSKDYLTDQYGNNIYGQVCKLTDKGWKQPLKACFVSRLSQEHGIIYCSGPVFDKIQPGDFVGIIPVHSCLAANLYPIFQTTTNKQVRNIHTIQ